MATGNSSMVWIHKKHEISGNRRENKNMNNLNILSFGTVSAMFCPVSAIFCPSFSWRFLVLDQIHPDFVIISCLQFQTKLEIPGSQSQYTGNQVLHEPVQSWQNMSFTTNTGQTCHSMVTVWILSWLLERVLPDKKRIRYKHWDDQAISFWVLF